MFPKTENEKYFGINLIKNKEEYQKLIFEFQQNKDKKNIKKKKLNY